MFLASGILFMLKLLRCSGVGSKLDNEEEHMTSTFAEGPNTIRETSIISVV